MGRIPWALDIESICCSPCLLRRLLKPIGRGGGRCGVAEPTFDSPKAVAICGAPSKCTQCHSTTFFTYVQFTVKCLNMHEHLMNRPHSLKFMPFIHYNTLYNIYKYTCIRHWQNNQKMWNVLGRKYACNNMHKLPQITCQFNRTLAIISYIPSIRSDVFVGRGGGWWEFHQRPTISTHISGVVGVSTTLNWCGDMALPINLQLCRTTADTPRTGIRSTYNRQCWWPPLLLLLRMQIGGSVAYKHRSPRLCAVGYDVTLRIHTGNRCPTRSLPAAHTCCAPLSIIL